MGNKSEPSSIRFDLEKLEFISKREGLEGRQRVVNFLFDDYWLRHKILPEYQKSAVALTTPPKTNTFSDEQKEKVVTKIKRSFGSYLELIKACEYDSEYENLGIEILAAEHLNDKEKEKLLFVIRSPKQ